MQDQKLISSADTIIFNGDESKELYLSTEPASESEFQIISFPDWVKVYPESGIIRGSITEIQITSDLTGFEPGIFSDELIIMSTAGFDTVSIIGLLGEQSLYSVPDSIRFSVFSEQESFIIKNNGNVTLTYSLSASDSYISFPSLHGEILVGEQKEIVVDVERESFVTGALFPEIYLNVNDVLDTVFARVESFKENKLFFDHGCY